MGSSGVLLIDITSEIFLLNRDMYGFVIDKLPTEHYANHYNVKGDNDEVFICWYAGDDTLGAGTEVGMQHIPHDNGWKIEPIMHI